METMSAFMRGKEKMVFDWVKAAKLIIEHNAKSASAGLSGDWEMTVGPILENGKPVPESETYVYLASTWATPELEIEGERFDCFVMESQANGWNEKTFWPDEALAILNEMRA